MKEIDVASSFVVKDILCALISESDFCKSFLHTFEEKKVFKELGASTIEKWALDYYRRYKKAVGSDVLAYYETAVRNKELSVEGLKYIEEVLTALSHYSDNLEKEFNAVFLLDQAIEFKNREDLLEISRSVDQAIKMGNADKAKELVSSFKAIENKSVRHIDLVNDADKVVELAFQEEQSERIRLNGDIGKCLNSLFTPASLILVRGSAKSKKSFTLNYLQTFGILQKNNVLVLQLGDLTEKQIFQRQVELLSKNSIKEITGKLSCLDCFKSQDGSCFHVDKLSREKLYLEDGSINSKYEPCSICRGKNPFPFTTYASKDCVTKQLNRETAKKYLDILKEHLNGKGSLRLLSYPAKTFSASDLEKLLEEYATADTPWVPDIIIIDSENLQKSDIFKADVNTETTERFIIYNRIRMKYNCCMLVGDQTRGREIYAYDEALGVETMQSDSFSGSTNKDRYATGAICLGRKSIGYGTQVITTSLVRDGGGIPDDSYLLLFQNLSVADIARDSYLPSPEDLKTRLDYIKAKEKTRKK